MGRIICLVMGYMFEPFQTGYLYGKHKGTGIRQHGGGSPGSTNTLRVTGVRAGLIVFLGDFPKTAIPYFLVRILSGSQPDYLYVWTLHAGLRVILEHNFPSYLNFKGSKGVAVAARIVAPLDWRLMLLCLAVSILVVTMTRYVSLGSLIASTTLVVWNAVMGQMGAYGLSAAARPEFYGISTIIAAMAFWKHRVSIAGPAQDKENKVDAEKK